MGLAAALSPGPAAARHGKDEKQRAWVCSQSPARFSPFMVSLQASGSPAVNHELVSGIRAEIAGPWGAGHPLRVFRPASGEGLHLLRSLPCRLAHPKPDPEARGEGGEGGMLRGGCEVRRTPGP